MSVATKQLVIILLGAPGAGKGTHAGPLSEKLKLPHISTGNLFREHISADSPLGKLAKICMNAGNLVPDELVFNMLFDRVAKPDCERGYILDGFPRTVAQAKVLDRAVQPIALYFSVPDEILIERMTNRLTCPKCNKPYSKSDSCCDVCLVPLIQRADDREEVVRRRLEVYHTQTQPVIDYYAKKNLIPILATGTREEIFQTVLKACQDKG